MSNVEPLYPARTLVALATYNERDTLPSLVTRIHTVVPTADILVVDDNSPDGTGQWCIANQVVDGQFHYVHRPAKLGLGSAAATAFGWGIERGYEWIVTMDADGSHDPLALRDLFAVLDQHPTVDVVIGSRYVAGGKVEGWPLHRRCSSRMVNGLARYWLGLNPRDCSGAFRLYRTSMLKKVDAASIGSSGYGYLEEILWRLQRAGARTAEVPIVFRQRRRGESKLNALEAARAVRDLIAVRWRKVATRESSIDDGAGDDVV
jgi:dolichol-phosphate mannosyltransferase